MDIGVWTVSTTAFLKHLATAWVQVSTPWDEELCLATAAMLNQCGHAVLLQVCCTCIICTLAFVVHSRAAACPTLISPYLLPVLPTPPIVSAVPPSRPSSSLFSCPSPLTHLLTHLPGQMVHYSAPPPLLSPLPARLTPLFISAQAKKA